MLEKVYCFWYISFGYVLEKWQSCGSRRQLEQQCSELSFGLSRLQQQQQQQRWLPPFEF